MAAKTPTSTTLQGFVVRLRQADGTEQTRIVRAADVVAASRLAAAELAIDCPHAEIVSVAWLGEALASS
ncbi:MAG: hypothetical protein H6742_17500 [Alphaproteobacteria bacterium]|nr:hypothetical protein [Alphaproteobacteria bacterium]